MSNLTVGLQQAVAIADRNDRRRRRGKPPPTPEEIKALRSRLGLSQSAFCKRYDLNLTNYQKWEQDRAKPFGSAITILRMIEAEPEATANLIAEARKVVDRADA